MKFNEENSKRSSLSDSKGGLEKKYEDILQKMEEEIRNHIRVEQQLKLLLESVKLKLEDTNKSLQDKKN
jgi:hypothetical protein